MNKTFVWGSAVLGIVFIAVAIYYWMTPAGSLATFMPGYEAGVLVAHFKHGLASLILGLALLVVAWFTSGPKRA
ncbi:MAG: hypothetical protein P4L81_04375 [Candidatus Pacebacteria bacterium]|nr:hypothetical protein [Candidatus Paceibacterota bacterium]